MRSIILLKNKRESVYVGVKSVLCRNISIIFYGWLFYTEFSVSAVLRLTVTVCPKSVWERRQRRGTADIGIKSVNAEMSKVSLLSLGAGQNVALYASLQPEVRSFLFVFPVKWAFTCDNDELCFMHLDH